MTELETLKEEKRNLEQYKMKCLENRLTDINNFFENQLLEIRCLLLYIFETKNIFHDTEKIKIDNMRKLLIQDHIEEFKNWLREYNLPLIKEVKEEKDEKIHLKKQQILYKRLSPEERREDIKKSLEKEGNYTCRYMISEKYDVTGETARTDMKYILKNDNYITQERTLLVLHKGKHIQRKKITILMKKKKENKQLDQKIKEEVDVFFKRMELSKNE